MGREKGKKEKVREKDRNTSEGTQGNCTSSLEKARSGSVNQKACFLFKAAGPRASGLIKGAKVEYPIGNSLWCRKLS